MFAFDNKELHGYVRLQCLINRFNATLACRSAAFDDDPRAEVMELSPRVRLRGATRCSRN